MVIGVSSCYGNTGVTTSLCHGKVENQCLVVFIFSNFSRDTEVQIREKKTFRTRKSESFLTSVRIRTSEPKSGILVVRTNPRIKVHEPLFEPPTSGDTSQSLVPNLYPPWKDVALIVISACWNFTIATQENPGIYLICVCATKSFWKRKIVRRAENQQHWILIRKSGGVRRQFAGRKMYT